MPPKRARPSRKAANPSSVPVENDGDSNKAEIRAPSLLNTFTMPARSQTVSSLLSMAAELRLKVLRYLLKNEGPIFDFWTALGEISGASIQYNSNWPLKEEQYGSTALETCQFSAQILRCCQQLYTEGRHILYKENVLMIQNFYRSKLSALNYEIEVPRPYNIDPYEDTDLLVHCLRPISHYPDKRSLRQIYPGLAEFDRFVVTLNITSRTHLYKLARTLKYLLRGKSVTVTVKKHHLWQTNRFDSIEIGWFSSFQVWRCKEIKFASHLGSEITQLENLIVSSDIEASDEVYELATLHPIYSGLCADLYVAITDAQHHMNQLEESIMSYDSKLVKKHKREFLKAARKAIKDGRQTHAKEIAQKKAQIAEEKARMDERRNQLLNLFSSLR